MFPIFTPPFAVQNLPLLFRLMSLAAQPGTLSLGPDADPEDDPDEVEPS
jgi:hypothetical protein